MSAPVRILTVCTGNICRSPAAERLLAQLLGDAAVVSSAGVQGLSGHPIQETMAQLMSADGVDTASYAARYLTEAMIEDANLVLTMTTEQRAFVVEGVPAALRRTFTLVEFAHLVSVLPTPDSVSDAGPADRLRAWIRQCGQLRGQAPKHQGGYDIADPYGLDQAAYELAWNAIVEAAGQIARALNDGGRGAVAHG